MKPRHALPASELQHGMALIALLALLLLGAAYFVVDSLSATSVAIERDKKTAAALAQAKDALIGFAVTYRDTHSGEVFGYLPLPDLGNILISTKEGEAAPNFSGNTKNYTVIGRLPWKTLGLPPLRDGYGECLWYAVSGSFKDNNKADVLNWDSIGHFDLYISNGTSAGTVSMTGSQYHERPVAVIFSAGAPLPDQDRSTSATDDVTECSGNYAVRNYLDPFTLTATINNISHYFSGSTNNRIGDASNFASPKSLIANPVSTADGTRLTNDRLLALMPDEIFARVKKRPDFAAALNVQINDLVDCLESAFFGLPTPAGATPQGQKRVGHLPSLSGFSGCWWMSFLSDNYYGNWKEQYLYATCTSAGQCLSVNGGSSNCRGVLIFPGERSASQSRASAAQRADYANYLEGANLTAFTSNATTFSGITALTTPPTSQDVVRCLND